MQTVYDRIISFLQAHPEGVDDDELARALGLKYRQQANQTCRRLEVEGLIERRKVEGKIRNFWKGTHDTREPSDHECGSQPLQKQERPWFWEGNVQASVCQFLKERGYSTIRVADACRRERGKDIEAKSVTGLLGVTAKGYPEATSRTLPATQAQHWFKDGFFNLVCWRGERKDVALALALPDFLTYRNLAEKVAWLQPIIGFSFIWVGEGGRVVVEGDL